MAKTLGNLRTGVRVYLDEANQADWLDTEVLRAINYAYQDVASEVMEVYEDFYFTTTPYQYSTVANQQEYSINSSLIKIRRVEINYRPSDPNSNAIRGIPIALDELPRNLANNTIGSGLFNVGYYIIGDQGTQKIGFVPVPDQTGTNNISVWGITTPADLVNDSDSVTLPYVDNFAHLIEMKAAIDLLRKGQQEEQFSANYMKEYLLGVQRMKTFIKERQADGVQTIQDVLYEDTSFDNPL